MNLEDVERTLRARLDAIRGPRLGPCSYTSAGYETRAEGLAASWSSLWAVSVSETGSAAPRPGACSEEPPRRQTVLG